VWFAEPAFRNDLQPVVVAQYPAVGRMLAWLGRVGTNALISARMTGSGAGVFAGFDSRLSAEQVFAQRPAGAGGFVASGLKQHPLIDCAS
jgi:4-diphosphocytidyl-2-C-methyl-D-erythritol kinase